MITRIKNGRIITPTTVLEGHDLLIENEQIIDIVDEQKTLEVDATINAEGQFISPGLIDIHTHGNSGYDFMDHSQEAVKQIATFLLSHGVTSFLATTLTQSKKDILTAIESIDDFCKQRFEGSSECLGIYLEGPYLAAEKSGAQPIEYIRNPNREELDEFIEAAHHRIKIVALAPELKNTHQMLQHLKRKNIASFAAHTNATYDETCRAITHGLIGGTHLFNGMRNFTHREPGVIGALLDHPDTFVELIADGVHVHPAALKMAIKTKGIDKVILISDAMRASGLKDGTYTLGNQKVIVKNQVARIESGSLAGSLLRLIDGVKYVYETLNIPLYEAIAMATINPAKAIKVDKTKGSIAIGKDADFIVFDNALNIKTTIKMGKVIPTHGG